METLVTVCSAPGAAGTMLVHIQLTSSVSNEIYNQTLETETAKHLKCVQNHRGNLKTKKQCL
jgi:hypothetical protein